MTRSTQESGRNTSTASVRKQPWVRLIKQLLRSVIFSVGHSRVSHLKRGELRVTRKVASLRHKECDRESSQTSAAGVVVTIGETKEPSTLLRPLLSNVMTSFQNQQRKSTLKTKFKISSKTTNLIHTSDTRIFRVDQQETKTMLLLATRASQGQSSSSRCLLQTHRCLQFQCLELMLKHRPLTRARYQLSNMRARDRSCRCLSFQTSRRH